MIRNVVSVVVLACLLLVSCSDSEDAGPVGPRTPPPPENPFADLTRKEHVLQNLVASYVLRDVVEYQRILDPDHYQFFFSDDDVNDGLPPDGWDITRDLAATTNLLNRNNPSPKRIVSIDLHVETANLQWVEEDAIPPVSGKWYVVVTTYRFSLTTAEDVIYATRGNPTARFTVRNVGTDPAPQWRLVRWQDLGTGSVVRVIPPGGRTFGAAPDPPAPASSTSKS